MPDKNNQTIKINCKNFHIAFCAEVDGVIQYEKPQHIVGLEKVSRSAKVANGGKYGDGVLRFSVNKKTAYELTIDHNFIPSAIRSRMEGTTITAKGVEYASSKDTPTPLAVGWETELEDGTSQFIWFLFGVAQPITNDIQQSEDNINFTSDNISLTMMEHNSLKRYYTFVDTSITGNEEITAEKFFSQVQTGDEIVQAMGA